MHERKYKSGSFVKNTLVIVEKFGLIMQYDGKRNILYTGLFIVHFFGIWLCQDFRLKREAVQPGVHLMASAFLGDTSAQAEEWISKRPEICIKETVKVKYGEKEIIETL